MINRKQPRKNPGDISAGWSVSVSRSVPSHEEPPAPPSPAEQAIESMRNDQCVVCFGACTVDQVRNYVSGTGILGNGYLKTLVCYRGNICSIECWLGYVNMACGVAISSALRRSLGARLDCTLPLVIPQSSAPTTTTTLATYNAPSPVNPRTLHGTPYVPMPPIAHSPSPSTPEAKRGKHSMFMDPH